MDSDEVVGAGVGRGIGVGEDSGGSVSIGGGKGVSVGFKLSVFVGWGGIFVLVAVEAGGPCGRDGSGFGVSEAVRVGRRVMVAVEVFVGVGDGISLKGTEVGSLAQRAGPSLPLL